MENTQSDRRAKRVSRVSHGTLVEICSRESGGAVFEAESLNMSGRGMLLHSEFLPTVQTALVLRFQHEGQEAVVEGQVAWRDADDGEGHFGVKFTALDSQSVRVLKQVCKKPKEAETERPIERPTERVEASPELDDESEFVPEAGAAIKLHIEGLAVPMKARVFEVGRSRLHLGSQLEFLQIGHSLSLEDVDGGASRSATIDEVNISIDPETQVPQLVVSVKYCEAEDETPSPSVVGENAEDLEALDDRHRPGQRLSASDDENYDPELDLELAEEMFKGRVEALASQAGKAMRGAGERVAGLSEQVASGMSGLFQATGGKLSALSSKSKSKKTTRRSSSSRPSGTRAAAPRSTRSVRGRNSRFGADDSGKFSKRGLSEARTAGSRRPRLLVGAAAAAMLAGGGYLFVQAKSEGAASQVALAGSTNLSAQAASAIPLPSAGPVPVASVVEGPLGSTALQAASAGAVVASSPPTAFPKVVALNTKAQLKQDPRGIVANVPLFGTQQMATTEPAPLAPTRSTALDEYGMAKDQTFAAAPPALASVTKAKGSKKASPAAGKSKSGAASGSATSDSVWQVGRMHLPIIHRLRLDGPGSVVQGSKTPSGFKVLIPGRKVMESGAGVASRDDRIANVRVKNTPAGGTVTFRFGGAIPGYKVRLRKDYVEFFVNAVKKK